MGPFNYFLNFPMMKGVEEDPRIKAMLDKVREKYYRLIISTNDIKFYHCYLLQHVLASCDQNQTASSGK